MDFLEDINRISGVFVILKTKRQDLIELDVLGSYRYGLNIYIVTLLERVPSQP